MCGGRCACVEGGLYSRQMTDQFTHAQSTSTCDIVHMQELLKNY